MDSFMVGLLRGYYFLLIDFGNREVIVFCKVVIGSLLSVVGDF